jgi:hypothetical protein
MVKLQCQPKSIKYIIIRSRHHDGAVQAYSDYKTGHDLHIAQHPCTGNSTDYCNGYNRRYTDEADVLG